MQFKKTLLVFSNQLSEEIKNGELQRYIRVNGLRRVFDELSD